MAIDRRQLVSVSQITLLVLVLTCKLSLAAKFKPDCSNTFTAGGTSFSTLETVCGQLADEKLFQTSLATLDELKRLETVESCSCALINHELAWAALVTHESETFYLAVKQFVSDRSKKDPSISALTKGETQFLFSGRDGDRRFYWDSLDFILKQATGENDDEEISLALRENFAKLYYEPATFKLRFSELVQSQKLRSVISGVCNSIIRKFATPFLPYFDRLSQLAENDHLFFILSAYNDDLYKLRMNTRACLYLMQKGQLLTNF